MCQVSLNLNALLIKSCSIRVENLTSDLLVKATEIENSQMSFYLWYQFDNPTLPHSRVIAFTNAGVIPHRHLMAER